VFLDETGMKGVNSFQDYKPVDDAVAEAYEKGRDPGPDGEKQYHLYFGEGWRTSRWNQVVINNFAAKIVTLQQSYRIPGECLAHDAIKVLLYDNIKQAQVSWKRSKPRVHFSGARYETQEEAHARAREQESSRAADLRSNTRKAQKYERRLECLDEILGGSLPTPSRRKWELTRQIVSHLGREGQSSEDTDINDVVQPLTSTIPYYRRCGINAMLEELDRECLNLQRKHALAKGKR
ncbi:hypothetical protein K435DRAFT_574366, partial [Dendrothele bispora CBS 962.96]